MTGLIRSELRKAFTTRTGWGMPLAQFLLAAVFVGITATFMLFVSVPGPTGEGGGAPLADSLDPAVLARTIYTGGLQVGYLLSLVLGILSMGTEYRHKTLTATFLASPRRGRVITSKVVALTLVVVINGLAHLAGALITGGAMLMAADRAVFPDAGDLIGVLARLLLVLVLWGLMGLGLGVLIPNQVAALFVGVAFAFLIEPLLGVFIGMVDSLADVARFFPSQASSAALSLFQGMDATTIEQAGGNPDQLSWWVAALVLLGYAAVMTLIGWVLTQRRDVG
ncbi:ABC transporter permease subunit [Ornithinimicrobium avium]|uniref:ABC transporter permease n=1 Tax=Ornithinimicrobium avium TaxID=2283195 RepID=A0A345NM84_9MICO|nr:ABC transporter permease subunit [Ornithinimicrobium avium]AXH96142.1 ABC transporter permease [Ornithinimicrobium avium]